MGNNLDSPEWHGFSYVLDPEVIVGPILDQIDTVLSYGISLLELADLTLSVMQSLLTGLLDPIRALVEALIAELKSLIRDLFNTGVYIASDLELFKESNNFADLVGGYQAYESRMVARLVDRTDPNRPDFAPETPVLAAFFYVSSGDVGKLIKAMAALKAFFSPAGKTPLNFPPPTTPKAEIDTGLFGKDYLTLTWSVSQVAGAVQGLMAPSPSGFVIEVSTIQNGVRVVSFGTNDQSSPASEPPKVASVCLDPKTGTPLQLYGGLGSGGCGQDADSWDTLEAGPQQIRFQIDQVTPLIKPSALKNPGGPPLLGAAYYVKAGVFPRLLPGQTFTTTIARDKLPKHASFDSSGKPTPMDTVSYFVRVRAVGPDLADAIEATLDVGLLGGLNAQLVVPVIAGVGAPTPMFGKAARLFFFSTNGVRLANSVRRFLPDVSVGLFSPNPDIPLTAGMYSNASGSVSATFPSDAVKKYQKYVQAAVAFAILGRLDLKPANLNGGFQTNRVEPAFATGAEAAIAAILVKYGWEWGLKYKVVNTALNFRETVAQASANIALSMVQANPPSDGLAEALADPGERLLAYKFKAITLFEMFESDDPSWGLAMWNAKQREAVTLKFRGGPKRGPAFMLNTPKNKEEKEGRFTFGIGSADESPVLMDGTEKELKTVGYFRNQVGPQSLFADAIQILRVAGATRPIGDSQWIAIRLFPQNLTPLAELVTYLEGFLDAVLDGLQSVIDALVNVIKTIRARLNQLQALLEQIRAMLRMLKAFSIPPVSALIVLCDGTPGALTKLVTSTDKPSDNADAYGAGMVVVAGGPNRFLLELFR